MLLVACGSEPAAAPWDAPVDGAVAMTAWREDGTPTSPFGPGGVPWDTPEQVVEAMTQSLTQGGVDATGRVVVEHADGSVVGWVRITVDDEPRVAGDIRLVMRREGDAWAVVSSESREHCSRPLTDEGECR